MGDFTASHDRFSEVMPPDNVESHFFSTAVSYFCFNIEIFTSFPTDFVKRIIPFEPRTPEFPVPEMVKTLRTSPKNLHFPMVFLVFPMVFLWLSYGFPTFSGKNPPWVTSTRPARDVWAPLPPCGHELLVQHWPTGKTWWFYWHSKGGCAHLNQMVFSNHLNDDGLTHLNMMVVPIEKSW